MFMEVNRMTILLNHEVEIHITHFYTINLKSKNMMKNDRTLSRNRTQFKGKIMKFETKCLHAGYSPKMGATCSTNQYKAPLILTILQKKLASYLIYKQPVISILAYANPTTNAAEEKITALEGGVATMCTASGQSAVFYAMLNILEAGDHFISSSYVYGGTYNLFAHTFKKWVSK